LRSAQSREPSTTASQRVSSNDANTLFSIMVSGTPKSAPTGPQSQPQKSIERKTTSVERPSARPMTRGSITLPTTKFTVRWPMPTAAAPPGPSVMSAISVGGMPAIAEPMVGM
jgi:hypothetical protein